MKAVLCKSLDGPRALTIEEISQPDVGDRQVLIRVRAAALNFFDTLITRGKYQFKPDLPFSPAGEIAGVVESVGTGVSGYQPGDRVMAYLGWGGAREFVVTDAGSLIPIPDGVSDAVAASVSITYATAIHGLRDRAKVLPGETVAVLGAAGGAGLAAIEIAKLAGASVIAVASSAEKLAVCEAAGADQLFDSESGDLKEALRSLTDSRGVDVVYDCVGGDQAEPALRAMAWGGRYLVVGFASGDIPKIPLNLLLLKGCSAVGVFWGEALKRDPGAHRANMTELLSWICEGRLNPRVDETYALDDIYEALQAIEQRKARGKIVLRVP